MRARMSPRPPGLRTVGAPGRSACRRPPPPTGSEPGARRNEWAGGTEHALDRSPRRRGLRRRGGRGRHRPRSRRRGAQGPRRRRARTSSARRSRPAHDRGPVPRVRALVGRAHPPRARPPADAGLPGDDGDRELRRRVEGQRGGPQRGRVLAYRPVLRGGSVERDDALLDQVPGNRRRDAPRGSQERIRRASGGPEAAPRGPAMPGTSTVRAAGRRARRSRIPSSPASRWSGSPPSGT